MGRSRRRPEYAPRSGPRHARLALPGQTLGRRVPDLADPLVNSMPERPTPVPFRLVQAYYWMTPVFLFVAWRYGFDVRVPFLDALPGVGAAYWGVLVLCAVLVVIRPNLTAIVGQAESTCSAGLLVVTTWTAYFNAIDAAAATDGTFVNPFTTESVSSLAMSAGVFIASAIAQRGRAGARRTLTL